MKTLILIVSCLLLVSVLPSQAAENQQQPKDPNQQLKEIEKYIASRHHEIENYYTDQHIELNQRAEAEISQLEIADKPIFASLAAQAEVAKVVLNINDYGYRAPLELEAKTEIIQQVRDERGYLADVIEISPKRFVVAQSRIAERKSEILAKLEQETADLEKQKNYALTVTLPELEKQLKQNQLKPEAKPTHGVVTGIVYSADKPSAIVDRQIIREGDVIYGVKIVKIYKDNVKFSKKSKNWEQKVQQAPEAYWK
ncbi:MAG: hypothetical protein WAK60_04645 [Sedimentisphaerales bacterium]